MNSKYHRLNLYPRVRQCQSPGFTEEEDDEREAEEEEEYKGSLRTIDKRDEMVTKGTRVTEENNNKRGMVSHEVTHGTTHVIHYMCMPQLVMLAARLKARSQLGLSLQEPSQPGPCHWLGPAHGPGLRYGKPEAVAQAMAFAPSTSAPSPVTSTLTTASQAGSTVTVPPAIEYGSEMVRRKWTQNLDMHDAPQTNENGMYNNVNIMGIDSDTPTETNTSKNKKNQKADLDQFFKPVRYMKGDKSGDGCNKTDALLVNKHTTLQRHMASKHKGPYQHWCKSSNFLSMLPEDAKTRCKEALDKVMEQSQVAKSLLSHANKAQQAFSSVQTPTLFHAIPAIKTLHAAWSSQAERFKYHTFKPALDTATAKLNNYHQKMADSDAHILVMLLHPEQKMNHFKKHWDLEPQEEVLTLAQHAFKEHYEQLQTTLSMMCTTTPAVKRQKPNGLLHDVDSENEENDDTD
ncbi:hypothetical protein F5148DRAFT_1155043, partial [Russula earlei]